MLSGKVACNGCHTNTVVRDGDPCPHPPKEQARLLLLQTIPLSTCLNAIACVTCSNRSQNDLPVAAFDGLKQTDDMILGTLPRVLLFLLRVGCLEQLVCEVY